MTKTCPIMSYRKDNWNDIFCMEQDCALWDEERNQCCILTQALAAAAEPPIIPVIMQPSVHTTPAVIPNSTGDWVKPDPYRIDCALERGEI